MVNARGDRPLCISCYNRDREVRVGKNAKGGIPTKTLDAWKLHTSRVTAIEDGQVRVVEINHCTGAAELILTLARKATGPMQFAFAPRLPPGVPLNPQFIDEVEDEVCSVCFGVEKGPLGGVIGVQKGPL
jgi:hypothetical protein